MNHILFVEDDELIASGLIYALEQEGYKVTHCKNVNDSIKSIDRADITDFTLGLLDLSLPDGTGYTICKALKDKDIPVIFLSAAEDEGNIVHGLEMGAEDYVTKPFRLRELFVRIRKVIDRNNNKNVIYINDEIFIDILQGKIYKAKDELELSALEYRLLLVLANNKGLVLTRNQILKDIWDISGNFVNDNTLTVYIKRLREKLGDENSQIIQTVRGRGYVLNG